jgi:NADPH:quinone reductase-like Zn-dependent oxidoreductase
MDSPFLPVEEWQNMLGKAGFSGIDIELDDYAQPYTMISTLLSSAVEAESLLSTPKVLPATGQADVQVLSVCGKRLTSYIDSLRAGPLGGSTYFWPQKVEALAEHDRVIILHDGGWPITTEDMQFQELKIILSKARSILWVNIMEEEVEIIPHAGVSTGLLRVMASENPSLAFTSIDIGKRDLIDMMQRIIALERTLQGGDIVSVNTEFRVSDGIFNISRLIPDEELNERSLQSMKVETELLPIGDQPPLAANFEKPGILGSVYFEEDPMSWMPLRDDELEVRTLAVGLNWKDLAVCAGRLDLNNFSSECAGVVTRIGEAVNGFRVGDRVFGLSKGKFGNYMRCNSSLVQPMRSDNFSDMATIPVVYMTAWYAFKHLARVQPGDKVLIQSASGGLGIAALNVARHLGAEIFVTVGTDDKRKFIQETYGIADAHIFSSRASPDLELIKDTTGHNGFDVVLSTVTGDSLNEWLRCLAPAGRFVDVGRVDVQDHATMAMEVFKRNATFSSFDLGILVEDKPKLCAKLLAEVSEMWHGGVLPPIALIRTFDVSQLGLALLYLSKGTHIGKVVITYQDPRSLICVSPRRSTAARFDPTAIYVLVGGLGGLGRSMISWMAERGARGIRILSRSPPSDSNSPFIAAMTSVGCKVEHVPCDVTRSTEVEAAIALASRSGTIRGVIHTAVMLQVSSIP